MRIFVIRYYCVFPSPSLQIFKKHKLALLGGKNDQQRINNNNNSDNNRISKKGVSKKKVSE